MEFIGLRTVIFSSQGVTLLSLVFGSSTCNSQKQLLTILPLAVHTGFPLSGGLVLSEKEDNLDVGKKTEVPAFDLSNKEDTGLHNQEVNQPCTDVLVGVDVSKKDSGDSESPVAASPPLGSGILFSSPSFCRFQT